MFVFYFFVVVLVWLGFLSLRNGWHFYVYVKQELAKPQSNYTPFASIISPCRGLDEDLRENLTQLFAQNYPAYEIVFVVDDERDEAVLIIEEVRRRNVEKVVSKLVVAGKAIHSGQKVHNLRRAIVETSAKAEVFVFADSDARPHENWLRSLVAPLADESIGATTGYRWFISKKRNFASELRACWNASIASALGADANKNFCWGGATAIRRSTFEQINMLEKWRGTLSDDFALMRSLRAANLPIQFVPQALTASIEDCGLLECLEFTTRQMKITRVYAAHFWKASFIGSALFTLVFFTGIILVVSCAVSNLSFWLPLLFTTTIFLLGAAKAWIRLEAVKLALPDCRKELNQSLYSQIILWTLTPPLYFYNNLAAAFSRTIRWRGIEYYLKSPNETVIINQP